MVKKESFSSFFELFIINFKAIVSTVFTHFLASEFVYYYNFLVTFPFFFSKMTNCFCFV